MISLLITDSDLCTSKDVLSSFPYYQNYVDLARLEYSIISAFLDTQPQNFAFVGSGPLPLTSLCLLDHCPNSIVLNIDRDTEAVRLSERLCRKLGFEDRVNFSCADITQQTDIDWKVFGVVFLAALVGEDTGSKMRILCDLRSKLSTGTLIIVRSAKGLREILYPVSTL